MNKTSGKDKSTAHSAGRDDDRDERGSQSEKRRPVGLRDGSARDTSAGEVNLLTVLDSSDTSADGGTSPMPPLLAVVYVLCEVVLYMPPLLAVVYVLCEVVSYMPPLLAVVCVYAERFASCVNYSLVIICVHVYMLRDVVLMLTALLLQSQQSRATMMMMIMMMTEIQSTILAVVANTRSSEHSSQKHWHLRSRVSVVVSVSSVWMNAPIGEKMIYSVACMLASALLRSRLAVKTQHRH